MGILFGAILPCLVGASTMTAVGNAAGAIVEEIRRQFREIPGLLEGKEGAEPEPAKIVDIATTRRARARCSCPGSSPIVAPVAHRLHARRQGARPARSRARSRSAPRCRCSWPTPAAPGTTPRSSSRRAACRATRRARDAHKAAVVGDTVGDPFKDTSGPGVAILIKVMSVVSLLIAPLIALR